MTYAQWERSLLKKIDSKKVISQDDLSDLISDDDYVYETNKSCDVEDLQRDVVVIIVIRDRYFKIEYTDYLESGMYDDIPPSEYSQPVEVYPIEKIEHKNEWVEDKELLSDNPMIDIVRRVRVTKVDNSDTFELCLSQNGKILQNIRGDDPFRQIRNMTKFIDQKYIKDICVTYGNDPFSVEPDDSPWTLAKDRNPPDPPKGYYGLYLCSIPSDGEISWPRVEILRYDPQFNPERPWADCLCHYVQPFSWKPLYMDARLLQKKE